jgi:type II secretory ATPase GspE/PulE/Tfp pilus assembly ATPase PilB-like protein
MDSGERNIVTIEDPVEIQLDGITQIPVNEAQGNTFPNLLRSVLRQDPDAILVGEIRDPETARTALQAATTGHLVFSTVHARASIDSIFRLLDLGVEPYLVASGVQRILAQRLVRKLCPYCKVPSTPTPEQLAAMGPVVSQGVSRIFAPKGCTRCLNTGFAGRHGIYELLTATDQLREIILRGPTLHEINKSLATTRFERLAQTGYQLVADGVSWFDEVERAVS